MSEGWIIDSGASQHMCKRREVLKEVYPTGQVKRVYVGDNSIVEVKGRGDVPIELQIGSKKGEGILKDVLHVQDMANNISFGEKGNKARNDDNLCGQYVQDSGYEEWRTCWSGIQ